MSEIDWSKAPVCADAAIVARPNNCHAPKTVYMREYSVNGCGIIGIDIDGKKISAMRDYWELVERPSPPEWNGEGLPPVGAFIVNAGDYKGKSEVILHRHGQALVEQEDGVAADYVLFGKSECRPAPTPDQIAKEDREKAVEDMMKLTDLRARDGAKQVFGALYDAGYRKVES